MKRIALRSTAALLTIAALGSTASAQSGYLVAWGKSEPTPAASAQKTERTSSGYIIAWGKSAKTDRASSGYMVAWGKTQPAD